MLLHFLLLNIFFTTLKKYIWNQYITAIHGATGCSKKSFKQIWQCHQLLSGFPSQKSLVPSIMSVANEMIPGTAHRSPGIWLIAEKNPRKPQLGDRLIKGLYDWSSPQMGSLKSKWGQCDRTAHQGGRRKERRKGRGILYQYIIVWNYNKILTYEDGLKSVRPSLHESWDKQLLGRDPDRSWCHHVTMSIIKLFWSPLMAPWASEAAHGQGEKFSA